MAAMLRHAALCPRGVRCVFGPAPFHSGTFGSSVCIGWGGGDLIPVTIVKIIKTLQKKEDSGLLVVNYRKKYALSQKSSEFHRNKNTVKQTKINRIKSLS